MDWICLKLPLRIRHLVRLLSHILNGSLRLMIITAQQARKILGKKAEKMTDADIRKLLNHLYYICGKTIDSVVNQNKYGK